MNIIDFHVHAFPDSLAPKALGGLAHASGLTPFTDGTLSGAKAAMKRWNTTGFVLLNIASTPSQERPCNDFCIGAKEEGIYPFGSVHPHSPNCLSELERIKAAGLRGIKFHNEYQGFAADDPAAYPVYERAAQLGLIMLFHGGFDPGFPQRDYASPARLGRVAEDFRGAKLVVAHLGDALSTGGAMEHLVGKELFLDTSMAYYQLPKANVKSIIEAHGAHRILYASDCPWGGGMQTQEYLRALGLTEEQLAQIFYKNAERLLEQS